MKKQFFLPVVLFSLATTISVQSDSARETCWKPVPGNYDVKQSLEIGADDQTVIGEVEGYKRYYTILPDFFLGNNV